MIRIVRMHFTEKGVEEFLNIFHANKNAIRNFEGCTHLELLKDPENKLIYTTLSHWMILKAWSATGNPPFSNLCGVRLKLYLPSAHRRFR